MKTKLGQISLRVLIFNYRLTKKTVINSLFKKIVTKYLINKFNYQSYELVSIPKLCIVITLKKISGENSLNFWTGKLLRYSVFRIIVLITLQKIMAKI